jgi:hypothetical protein
MEPFPLAPFLEPDGEPVGVFATTAEVMVAAILASKGEVIAGRIDIANVAMPISPQKSRSH